MHIALAKRYMYNAGRATYIFTSRERSTQVCSLHVHVHVCSAERQYTVMAPRDIRTCIWRRAQAGSNGGQRRGSEAVTLNRDIAEKKQEINFLKLRDANIWLPWRNRSSRVFVQRSMVLQLFLCVYTCETYTRPLLSIYLNEGSHELRIFRHVLKKF